MRADILALHARCAALDWLLVEFMLPTIMASMSSDHRAQMLAALQKNPRRITVEVERQEDKDFLIADLEKRMQMMVDRVAEILVNSGYGPAPASEALQ